MMVIERVANQYRSEHTGGRGGLFFMQCLSGIIVQG